MIDEHETIQLIDIRTEFERSQSQIENSLHISFLDLEKTTTRIRKDCPVVLFCQHGNDSFFATLLLMNRHKLDNVYTLKGGMIAWLDAKKNSEILCK